MEALAALGIPIAVLGGFLIAVYGFRQVSAWLFYSWAQLKPDEGRASLAAFLAALFLSPGPWFLITLAVASSYFATAWWFLWAAGGVAAGAAYVAAIAVVVVRKSKRGANERAA